ncbi:unannotated protein [freshwater metagenome]|uniref:Unannotated protein n=1 Tax=freshwater metagenome TaxID=449393 RepID=A0A6J6G0F7_9ZZZZ
MVIKALAASSGPSPLCSAHGANSDFVTSDENVRSSQGAAGSSNSAPVATKPRFPKRFRAVLANFSELVREKSAPSNPKAKSIFAPNSCIIPLHAAPSPKRSISFAVSTGSVERIAVPALQTTPVGDVVFLYITPRFVSSSARSAYAGPPTNNGCQLESSSWVKPGRVAASVRIAPPATLFRSQSKTFQPDLDNTAPATSAFIPLPTTIAS